MTPTEVLRRAQEQQGWSDATALDVVLSFIEDEGGLVQERFRQHVQGRVRGDEEASEEDVNVEASYEGGNAVISQSAVGGNVVQIANVTGRAVVNQSAGDISIQIGPRKRR